MTLLMRDQLNIEQGIEQGIKQGIEQGIEQGEKKLSQLIAWLMKDKRQKDVIRATQDIEYRNKLYEEYFTSQQQ